MHSIVLITAMTATTGLFGKHCGQPKHHARKVVASCYSSAPCGTTHASPYASNPVMTAPQATPAAPAKMVPPSSVPPAPAVPPAPTAVPTPSPSSALAPANQPVVATGGVR